MAYTTKTPASAAALLTEMLNFAATNLGAVIQTTGSASGMTQKAIQMPSGAFITFAENATEIFANTSTAWAPSTDLVSQTGACYTNARFRTTATPVKAWLFSDGYSVHVVINPTPAAYHHFSFGTLEKFGTYTGGEYVAASNLSSNAAFGHASWAMPHSAQATNTTYLNHVRVDYQGRKVAVNGSIANATASNFMCFFAFSPWYSSLMAYGDLMNRQPNDYNGKSMIIPHQYFLGYDIISSTKPDGWIPIGAISNSGYINIENIAPEQVVNTDWMAFPLCMKNPTSPVLANLEVNTRNIGLAYKK